MKYACNCLKHQNNQTKYFHNFEVGQRVLEFGQRDGKMYYKIQNIYQQITLRWVTEQLLLWDRPKGPVPYSEAQSWGIRFKCCRQHPQI